MLYCNVKKYIKTNICCLNQSEHEGTRYPCSECDHVAVQIQSLRQHIRVSPLSIQYIRAGEPAIFLSAPAPALDFFFKRLRLLIFFPSGSGFGSWYFFRAAPAPAPAPWQNILFPGN